MTPDELKIMPKDTFIVTRTGVKPMKTILRLFFEWGIELDEPYQPRQSVVQKVAYANRSIVEELIHRKYGFSMQQKNLERWKKQRKTTVQQVTQDRNTEKIRKVKT